MSLGVQPKGERVPTLMIRTVIPAQSKGTLCSRRGRGAPPRSWRLLFGLNIRECSLKCQLHCNFAQDFQRLSATGCRVKLTLWVYDAAAGARAVGVVVAATQA